MKKNFAKFILGVYILSTVISYTALPKEAAGNGGGQGIGFGIGNAITEKSDALSPTGFGIMCISAAYPNIDTESLSAVQETPAQQGSSEQSGISQGMENADDEERETIEIVANDGKKENEPRVFGKDPVVLIVHTHATESYLPSSEGNYHRTGRLNTVRDAGDVLAETLDAAGVPCIHDSTLHDEKSYNQAYSRSYETIQALLKKYPSIECVIDLHRDAIPGKAKAATVSVKGKTCAKYSYVVSNAVPTYKSNLKFVKEMNKTAQEDYSGFTGAVLERGYRYNQDLSSKYMLLEIGYNRNDITEVRNTAQLFGEILAKTLKAAE